ncbi:hypothetical protein KFE25_008246 [Diacronema lutheri]|uniref:Uncharacterized protein n=1 Tax=Diacronema lutheri TaxID=2081491 RepID=A0A8J6C9T7_DIALT|nr:hypothetical protein KFE25_008246 [Diacronema lutheri]
MHGATMVTPQKQAGTMPEAEIEYETVEGRPYHDINELLAHGVDKATLKKLCESHIRTVERVHMEPLKNLVAINGLSEAKAKKVRDEAVKLLGWSKFTTAADRLALSKDAWTKVSTGSTELDAILGGGLQRKHITQVYGEFRSGKSMLAHTMCVTAQKPIEQGGGSGRAMFIDTEGTFDERKLVKIAEAHGLDPAGALSNIDVCRVHNYEDLNQTIQEASQLLIDGNHSFIAIDSIATPFRNEFLGRGDLSVRQQELQKTLTFLAKTIEEYNLACLLTNQVMANPENGGMPGADPRRAVLGFVLSHRSQTILNMKKGAGEKRIVKLTCSPTMPEADAEISISEKGITDFSGK